MMGKKNQNGKRTGILTFGGFWVGDEKSPDLPKKQEFSFRGFWVGDEKTYSDFLAKKQ